MTIPTTDSQTSDAVNRQRHAFRVAVILLGAIALNAILSFRLGVQSGAWQYFARGGVVVTFGAATLYGLRLIRQDRSVAGIWLIIGTFLTTMTLTAGLMADFGIVLGVIQVLIVSMIATYALPPKQIGWAVAISLGTAAVTLLIEFIDPAFRLPAPAEFKTALPVLAGIVVLLNTILILRQFKSYSLLGKLIAVLTGMTVITTLIVGGFFIYIINTDLRAQIVIGHAHDVEMKVDGIETFLTNAQADVRFLSQSLAMEQYLEAVRGGADSDSVAEAVAALEAEFRTFARSRPIYDQVRFLDVTGQEIVRIDLAPDGAYQVVVQENLQNKSQRYYFEDSINLPPGEVFVSPLDLNVEQGQIEQPHKPVLRYGAPVFDGDRVAGVVVTNILAENFLALLGEGRSPAFLVDTNGYYLYHPDESKRWGRDLGTGVTVSQDYPELAPRLFSGLADTFTIAEQFFAFTPVTLPGEDAPRWYLAGFRPAEELFAPAEKTRNTVMVLVGAAIMGSALMAVVFSRILARPLLSLTQAAESMAEGDWSVRVSLDSRDEVGTLARAFNTMAGYTQDAIDSLATRVAERTQELALAAEVGRSVSQVQEVAELLATAVAIIRSRFDLYYTQIYLVDDAGRNLILKEGTGDVGTKLVARAHRLPIGPGSINGSAAAQKRAVIVPDTAASSTFFANPLLPDTRSEMAVPLLIGSRVVGVLDLQSSQPNSLTEGNLPAFEALAGQLAIAIENANLFTEAAEARIKVEAQARRLARVGWENFLNAAERREYIGYYYENGAVESLSEPLGAGSHDNRLPDTPVMISGEPVGTIRLKIASGQEWTSDDAIMVAAVAQQVSQQIENLRLLTEAERYRSEAETAVRRLTREGWDGYLETAALTNTGYLYDQNQVVPLTTESDMPVITGDSLSRDLMVQGETIGYLDVAETDGMGEGADELVTAVARQLSAHIENLRLAAQTEEALAETAEQARRLANLNEMDNALGAADTMEEVFTAVTQHTGNVINHDSLALTLVEPDGQTIKTFLLDNESDPIIIGTGLLGAGTAVGVAMKQRRPVNIPDLQETSFNATRYMLEHGLRSSLITPFITARDTIGALSLSSKNPGAFDIQDENMIQQIASLLASIIESQRLFAETQKQADKERLVNTITQKIQNTVTMESALQTTIQELGQALQARYTQVKLAATEENGKA